MKSKSGFWLALAVFVLVGVGIVYDHFAHPLDPDASWVVWFCQSGGKTEICHIKTDGSNFGILKDTDAESQNYKPSVNASGQVVYTCFAIPWSSLDLDICGLTIGNDERRRILTGNRTHDLNPWINDNGLIAYMCEYERPGLSESGWAKQAEICVSDFKIEYQQDDDRNLLTSSGVLNRNPQINNNGAIAYACQQGEDYYQLCTINSNGSGALRITADGDYMNGYSINNSNLIAFGCQGSYQGGDFCTVNSNGTGFLRVNFTETGYAHIDPVLDDQGRVITDCRSNDDERTPQICIMQIDGSLLAAILPPSRVSNPQLSSTGAIIYICSTDGLNPGPRMYSINEDGTGFRQLLKQHKVRHFSISN